MRRVRAPVRCGPPSRRLPAHSGSNSGLLFRKMPSALFRRNLPSLQWAGSSGFINLLVVRSAINLLPSYPTDSNQGPRRPGKAVPGLNCFPFGATRFHHAQQQGADGNVINGVREGSSLFVSDLRAVDFLLFFVAIAALLAHALRRRIVQFNDRSFHPRQTALKHTSGLT